MTRLWAEGDPVDVVSGDDGLPVRFQWRGTWHEVELIANRWRVAANWWTPAAHAQREYVKLATTDGLLCTLYRDLVSGAWWCSRVYD
jgi:hypothetical protein